MRVGGWLRGRRKDRLRPWQPHGRQSLSASTPATRLAALTG